MPSDQIFTGTLHGVDVAFLPRHGRGHVYNPSNVNYQANICALKMLGVTDIVAMSACGSLREDMKPGEFVLVDQFIDRTFKREKSFFNQSCVAHVSVAEPVCPRLSKICHDAMQKGGVTFHEKGTYLTMEGPQFSTKAESLLYRENWKCDVIGMTNMPEAKLAREAEICYAPIAMVTDFDCWHPDHENVEVSDIVKTLTTNAATAKSLVKSIAAMLPRERDLCSFGCDRALELPSSQTEAKFQMRKNALASDSWSNFGLTGFYISRGNFMDLTKYIRTVPDFPEPGIMFRDVTTLFAEPVHLRR